MCAECCAGNANCPACRALLPTTDFPFDERATLEELLTHALRAYQREWQACALATLLYVMIVAGGSWLISIASSLLVMAITKWGNDETWLAWVYRGLPLVQQLVLVPVQALSSLGFMRMMLDVVQGRSPATGRFFGELRLMPRALLIQVPFTLVLSIPTTATMVLSGVGSSAATGVSCLFLPLFLLFGLSWWLFSIPELVISDCSALEAMQRAWSLGSELRRFRVLGYAALAGALLLAGVLACFVGVFAGLPFGALLMLSLFLALRNSTSLPAPRSL